MFYAIMTTSVQWYCGSLVEYINGRRYWNFMELYGTLRLGKSSGTLWNFIMSLMERTNYARLLVGLIAQLQKRTKLLT